MKREVSKHESVLLQEGVELLDIHRGVYVDCTLGGGGYTFKISEQLANCGGGEIVVFEVDKDAIQRFSSFLKHEGWKEKKSQSMHPCNLAEEDHKLKKSMPERAASLSKGFVKQGVKIYIVHRNFENLSVTLQEKGLQRVDGIVADLGLSTDQIEDCLRGFSYRSEGPLDMRMDKRLQVSAADIVNGFYEKELVRLFRQSDEVHARRIAQAIVKEREKRRILQTQHLIQIIQKALPSYMKGKSNRSYRLTAHTYWIKPAMRVFQALRIAVNSELSSLHKLLPQVLEALRAGGIFVCVTFHSGEDRIVKRFFKKCQQEKLIKILTKKPVKPKQQEIERNIRARSAKLRAYQKV